MIAHELPGVGHVGRVGLLTVGLALAVALRWAATVSGRSDGVAIGLAFGLVLAGIAVASGWRPVRGRPASVAIGLVGGGLLVALAVATRSPASPDLAIAAPFLPWTAATVVVAVAEEAIFRGALFESVEEIAGVSAAVLATSLLFALIHVPLYGWHVVPLDLGVGLFLAGLRLGSGGVVAPALAHAVADLATWWL
jgi:membrane protease YdiL (CAAX protease family)